MPRKISEECTRKQMIDPQLEKAGWYLYVMMSEAGRQVNGLFESLLSQSFDYGCSKVA
jgi:type I site-specific restriction endonuclease